MKPLFKQSSTGGYEYSLETSASGQVSFTCLPSGAYRLKASWNKEGSFLAFEPKEKLITVGVKAEDVSLYCIPLFLFRLHSNPLVLLLNPPLARLKTPLETLRSLSSIQESKSLLRSPRLMLEANTR